MATILVVDDRATNRQLLVTLFGYVGHRILEAADGTEGLAQVQAERPDLVITDLVMPTMDGYEFVRQLRGDPAIAATPVIFYTAHYQMWESRPLAQAGGVIHQLTKPAKPQEILRLVEQVLAAQHRPVAAPPTEEFDREHLRLLTDQLARKVDLLEEEIAERKRLEKLVRQRADEKFRQLLEAAPDAMLIVRHDGSIALINRQAEQLFGYPREELLGQPVEKLMPERLRARHPHFRDQFFAQPSARVGSAGLNLLARRKDGSEFPVEINLSPLETSEGLLVTAAVRDISARKRLEQQVLEVAASEQRRIGHELHDGAAQALTGLCMLSYDLANMLGEPTPQLKEGALLAQRIAQGLKSALGEVRGLARGLIPVEVGAEGLMAALGELAQHMSELHKVPCVFDCRAPVPVEDNHTATQLFRIAQEAMMNALKHARASTIRVRLEIQEQQLTLWITDDGVGIPVNNNSAGKGMGLDIMRYRAHQIGAHLLVAPGIPRGTVVSCALYRGARDSLAASSGRQASSRT